MNAFPTRFASTLALSELPFFLRSAPDRLALADPSLGPIVDIHTHLALGYGPFGAVDLLCEQPRTAHYLPVERAIDLEGYANLNYTPADLRVLRQDLMWRGFTPGGLRRTHTAPNLLREARELGIVTCCLLPIDFPGLGRNAAAYLDVARREPGLLALGSVHPFLPRVAERLAAQKAAGARGVKVHPAVQLVPADHPRAMVLYRAAAELDLFVLFHCGPVGIEPAVGRACSQLKHYWRAVKENPQTRFVLGHSGALQFDLALDLARLYPNVWLETSSQSLTNVRRLVAEAPPERLLFGSDWPFYPQAFPLAKLLIATAADPAARRRVLFDNARTLLGELENLP